MAFCAARLGAMITLAIVLVLHGVCETVNAGLAVESNDSATIVVHPSGALTDPKPPSCGDGSGVWAQPASESARRPQEASFSSSATIATATVAGTFDTSRAIVVLSAIAWYSFIMVCAVVGLAVVLAAYAWSVIGTSGVINICKTTLLWWRGLAHYWIHAGKYNDFPFFTGKSESDVESRVYIRSIALAMSLWSLPHYRNGSFREDMEKNLRNVAIPGTGVPLSMFCRSKLRFYFGVLVFAPMACLFAAAFVPDAVRDESEKTKNKAAWIASRYEQLLLHPKDWFTLWRINCVLASYHAHVTKSIDYRVEDKWTFLEMAEKKGIPVSPTLDMPAIVVKDRNEEGGMGLHFFANARHNGRWIIQKVLGNAPFVANLLPQNAPLSTIRIVTASTIGVPGTDGAEASVDSIKPLSAVLRLGRAGALTDHDAILFDTDLATGTIREGTINKQWYKLGWDNVTLSLPALTHPPAGPQRFTSHPDSGVAVTGKRIPGMDEIRDLVTRAHLECCPTVPLCGWDVSLSDEGTLLLEVNLSCNFFQATIDRDQYFRFVDKYFHELEQNTPTLA